jgi:putative acetyltransferase
MRSDNWQSHVRAYREEDCDAIIEVYRAAVRISARRDYSEEQVRAWAPDQANRDRWLVRYRTRPAWVVDIDGTIAGFTDLEDDGHLDMMFVHPAFDGRGVASALLAQVEARAALMGLSRIFVEASLTARPFFERKGFTVIAQQEVTIRGQTLTNFRMEKIRPATDI